MSSFSVIAPDEILNHQLNDSKAKYHYSFNKDARFKTPKAE